MDSTLKSYLFLLGITWTGILYMYISCNYDLKEVSLRKKNIFSCDFKRISFKNMYLIKIIVKLIFICKINK